MARIFKDMRGLKAGIQKATMQAQSDTLHQALDKLLEFVEEDVYSLPESEWYERTGDLLRSFFIEEPKTNGLGIQATGWIKFDESKISHNTTLFQHGSPSSGNLDPTVFFGILNGDVQNGSMFPDVDRQPFWNDFMNWMQNNYEQLFQQNLQKYI